MAHRLNPLIAIIAVLSASMTGCSRPHSLVYLSPETITAHIPRSFTISPFAHPSSNADLFAGDRAVTAKNYSLAMRLYENVAQHSHGVVRGQAETRIAYLYLYAMGRVRDPVAALRHMKAAAELGDPFAEANLAYLYSDYPGAPHDYAQARKWADASATQGVTWAMDWMGWNYMGAYGWEERNLNAARLWYRKSADFGDPLGEYQLGWIYEHREHNYAEAMKWYLKLADQGNAVTQAYRRDLEIAQNNIGYFYENGLGVPRNFSLAAKWYERSASEGFSRAQYHLATLYARGLGVPKDLKKGKELARKAAAGGDWQATGWLLTHVFDGH